MLLRHPKTGEVLTAEVEGQEQPKQMYLTLLGPDSPVYQRLFRAANIRANKRGDSDMSDEEIAKTVESDSRMLSQLCIGGEIFGEGQWHDLAENKDVRYKMFKTVSVIRAQALEFITEPGNYLKAT